MNFLHVTVITVRLARLLRIMQIHAFPGNRSCRRIPIHRRFRFRYPCRLIRSVRQHRLKLLCRLFAHGTFRQFGKRLSLRLLIIHIPAHTAFKYHCHTLLLCIFRFLLPTFRTKIEHLKIIIQNLPAKLCRQRSRQIFEHHVRQSAALSAHQMIMTPFPVITIR